MARKSRDSGPCNVTCVKTCLLLFNILLLLSGVALLAVGLWVVLHKFAYVTILSGTTYALITYIVLGVGGVTVLVVFTLGCIGAWKEIRCLLIIYAVLLGILFLAELASAVLAYSFNLRLENELTSHLNSTMLRHYGKSDSYKYTRAIDSMQTELKCCGAGSFEDWLGVRQTVPTSCCITQFNGCSEFSHHPSNIRYEGCMKSLLQVLRRHTVIVSVIVLSLCLLQVIGVLLAIWLLIKIDYWAKQEKKYKLYK